jgi:hypothetical protein
MSRWFTLIVISLVVTTIGCSKTETSDDGGEAPAADTLAPPDISMPETSADEEPAAPPAEVPETTPVEADTAPPTTDGAEATRAPTEGGEHQAVHSIFAAAVKGVTQALVAPK